MIPVLLPHPSIPLVNVEDWRGSALCRPGRGYDPEIFFPEKGQSARRAREICKACPVKVECRETALRDREGFGIWGGTTEDERQEILKKRGMRRSTGGHEAYKRELRALTRGRR